MKLGMCLSVFLLDTAEIVNRSSVPAISVNFPGHSVIEILASGLSGLTKPFGNV